MCFVTINMCRLREMMMSKGNKLQLLFLTLFGVWGGLNLSLGKLLWDWDWMVYPIMPICWVIGACGCSQCKVVGIPIFPWSIGWLELISNGRLLVFELCQYIKWLEFTNVSNGGFLMFTLSPIYTKTKKSSLFSSTLHRPNPLMNTL